MYQCGKERIQMGLSASQARLLSLTARISDNELHSQQIKTQDASREYMNALDANKLMYTQYNTDGNAVQSELTAAVMYQYGDVKNQYGLVNTQGQLLISGTDAKNFEESSNLSEFCAKYGISTVVNPTYTETLQNIYGSNYETINSNDIDELETIKNLISGSIQNIQNDLNTIPDLSNPDVSHNTTLNANISNMENNIITNLGSVLNITKDDLVNKTEKLDGLGAVGSYLKNIHYTPDTWPTVGATDPGPQPPTPTVKYPTYPTEPPVMEEPQKPSSIEPQPPEFIPPDPADYSEISYTQTVGGGITGGSVSKDRYNEIYVREDGRGIFDVLNPDNDLNLDWYLEILAHLIVPQDDIEIFEGEAVGDPDNRIILIDIVPDEYKNNNLTTTTEQSIELTSEFLNNSSINNSGKIWDFWFGYLGDIQVYWEAALEIFKEDSLRSNGAMVSTDPSDYIALTEDSTEDEKLLNNYKFHSNGNKTLKTWHEKAKDLYYLALKVYNDEQKSFNDQEYTDEERNALTQQINEGIKELLYEDAEAKSQLLISGIKLNEEAYQNALTNAWQEYEASSDYQTYQQNHDDWEREWEQYEEHDYPLWVANQTAWAQYYKDVEQYKIDLANYNSQWDKYRNETIPKWQAEKTAYEQALVVYEEDVEAWKKDVESWLNSLQKAYYGVSGMIDSLNKIIDKEVPDPENAMSEWYTNLWHRMNGESTTKSEEGKSGKYYKILEDNLYTSAEWLQFALEHGVVTLEQVKYVEQGEEGTGLKTSKWTSTTYSSCSDIVEVEDEVAVARAEAKYTQKLNELQAKDKKYDSDLKKLDTEHNALQTEYDSIKSVIEKNVERSFKAFS